jgi:hypothetical protein
MAPPIPITRAEYEARFGGVAAPVEAPVAAPIPITRAEYQAKFSPPVPSIWSDPIDALTSYDWWTTRPDGSKSGLIGPVMAAGQGLTFGTMDEIAAGGNALLDRIFSGVPLSEAYDQRLEQARGGLKEYQDSSPGQAFAIELLGAANMPIKSKIAEKTGIGAKTVQAMKEGGTLGALYGYGSGEGGAAERAKMAAISGGIGAGAGAVLTPAIEGTVRGGQWLADKAAELGITPTALVDDLAEALFSGSASSQRGSISNRPTGAGLTAEELYLARRLKNVPASEIDRAAAELAEADSRGVPLYLQEALGDRGVMSNANLVATQPGTAGQAGRAIEARTAATRDRMSNLLSGVSDEIDPYTGAQRLQSAGKKIVGKAKEDLKEIGEALYRPAYDLAPTIDDPRLVELIDSDKYLRDEIRSLQNTAEYSKLPQNSTELLVNSRSGLDDRINKLAEKEPNLARAIRVGTYNKLNEIIGDAVPEVRAADEIYAAAAQKIDDLNSTFLGYLNKLGPDKIDNVTQLLDRPPTRISALRDKFIDAGLEQEWNAGVRSVLDLKLMGMKSGQNMADRLAGVPEMEKQIRAALGDKADDVMRGLFFEDKIARGKNAYAAGSMTQPRMAEADDIKQAASLFESAVKLDFKGVVGKLFDEGMPEELAQGLADIYFNPTRGKDSLTRVASLLDDYARNRRAADAVVKGSNLASTRGAAIRGKDVMDLGTIGMRGATDAQGDYSTWQQIDANLNRQGAPSGRQSKAPSSPQGRTGSAESPRSEARSSSPATQDKASPNPKDSEGKDPSFRPVSYTEEDSLFNDLFEGADMRNVKDVEAEIDRDSYLSALYETESGRNPKAKNPKSTASGGFQFIKSTAKSLGVSDPFDLEQSLTAVRQLTDEHKRLFGNDPAVLYSAHFLGSPLLRKLQRGDALTVKEQEIVDGLLAQALPRFLRIYKKVSDRDTNNGGGQVEA